MGMLSSYEETGKEGKRYLFRQTSVFYFCSSLWGRLAWPHLLSALRYKYAYILFLVYHILLRNTLPTLSLLLWKNLSQFTSSGLTSPVSETLRLIWGVTILLCYKFLRSSQHFRFFRISHIWSVLYLQYWHKNSSNKFEFDTPKSSWFIRKIWKQLE
jgi:hypothetical protein